MNLFDSLRIRRESIDEKNKGFYCFSIGTILILFSASSFADLPFIDPASGDGVMDQVINRFYSVVKSWQNVLQTAAINLFWTLALISMVWMGGMLLLRRADIGDFFVEFTRFIIFTGFFYWLLINAVSGHNIAGTIISSMQQLGGSASGGGAVSPSSILNVGMYTFKCWNVHFSSNDRKN